jgi:hypothetical protein
VSAVRKRVWKGTAVLACCLWICGGSTGCTLWKVFAPRGRVISDNWTWLETKSEPTSEYRYTVAALNVEQAARGEVVVGGSISAEQKIDPWHLFKSERTYQQCVETPFTTTEDIKDVIYSTVPPGKDRRQEKGVTVPSSYARSTEPRWDPVEIASTPGCTLQWRLIEAEGGAELSKGDIKSTSSGQLTIKIAGTAVRRAARNRGALKTLKVMFVQGAPSPGAEIKEIKIPRDVFVNASGDA